MKLGIWVKLKHKRPCLILRNLDFHSVFHHIFMEYLLEESTHHRVVMSLAEVNGI